MKNSELADKVLKASEEIKEVLARYGLEIDQREGSDSTIIVNDVESKKRVYLSL